MPLSKIAEYKKLKERLQQSRNTSEVNEMQVELLPEGSTKADDESNSAKQKLEQIDAELMKQRYFNKTILYYEHFETKAILYECFETKAILYSLVLILYFKCGGEGVSIFVFRKNNAFSFHVFFVLYAISYFQHF